MPEIEKNEEVKSINGKVLAFGLITIAAVLAVFCMIMVVAFFVVAGKYVDKSNVVLEQSEVILTHQRSLNRAEGKLQVYEAYLVNRNIDIVRNLIKRYLKTNRKRSNAVTLDHFEMWLGLGGCTSVAPDYEGKKR